MGEKDQFSFAAGEISPSLYGRFDLGKYATGLKTAKNFFVHAQGGASNRPGLEHIKRTKLDDGSFTRVIGFQFNTEQTYCLEFGDKYVRVYKDGAIVLEDGVSITAITSADPAVVTAPGHTFTDGKEVYISGVDGCEDSDGFPLVGFFIVRNPAGDDFELFKKPQATEYEVDSTALTAYSSGGTVSGVYDLVSPYAAKDLPLLKYIQSADVMTLTHPDYPIKNLTRTDHNNWAFENLVVGANIGTVDTGTITDTSFGRLEDLLFSKYTYAITAVNADGEEGEAVTHTTAFCRKLYTSENWVQLSWDTVPDAVSYNVYRWKSGVYGFVGPAGEDGSPSFLDESIIPITVETPPEFNNPFNATDNYPSTATYHQDRLIFANTNNRPNTFFASQNAAYSNFNSSRPVRDSDSITATIVSRQVNEIYHLISLDQLIAFTSGSEALITSSDGEVITPSSINIKPQTYYGCSERVVPLIIGNTALYVQNKGSIVRSIAYSFESDGYRGNEVSILSNHLVYNYTIDDWCYQQTPDSLVWSVRSDGNFLCLTFQKEHEVFAWTQHNTDGNVKSIMSIGEGNEDSVYAIVERTITDDVSGDPFTYQAVERLHTRNFKNPKDAYDVRYAFFVDAGLTLNNPVGAESIVADEVDGVLVGITVADMPFDLSDGDVIRIEDAIGSNDSVRDITGDRAKVVDSYTDSGVFYFYLANIVTGARLDANADGTYSGLMLVRKATNKLKGLDHLNGKTVSILADGNVHPQVEVVNGVVDLQYYAAHIHVGLPYTSDLETLDMDIRYQAGSFNSNTRVITSFNGYFQNSRGGFFGPNFGELTEIKQRRAEAYEHPTDLQEGYFEQLIGGDWNGRARVVARQVDPLPLTILSIMTEVEIGEL